MSEKLSVKVKTKELLEAVKVVENFISTEKIGKEYLKGICIEANKKENNLILRTTDLKMSAKVEIMGQANGNGKAVVSCKTFKELIKDISDTDVCIMIEKEKILIQTKNSKSTISIIGDIDFPEWADINSLRHYSVQKSELKNLFENVKFLIEEEYATISEAITNKMNEIKQTEENLRKTAKENAEKEKQQEIEALRQQQEQEKQEAVAKAIKEKEVKENSNDNFEKTDTYICIKVNGLTKEATNDLLEVIKKHNLKYIKEMK